MDIKYLAYAAMFLDHAAIVFLKSGSLYVLLRMIGRIAFPIFVYSTVRGFYFTSDLAFYRKRLLFLAVVSQLPYFALFGHYRLNVLFELYGILLFLSGIRMQGLRQMVFFFSGMLVCAYSDYQFNGLVLAAAFYGLIRFPRLQLLCCCLLAGRLNPGLYAVPSALTIPVIYFWMTRGWHQIKSPRWQYLIYPLHLIFLLLIR